MILTTFLLFLSACLILIFAGSLAVRALLRLTAFLHMEEFIVSFIIMAFSTSIPELMVGITSALHKNNAIALGTVIGSNMADVTLIAGIVILLNQGIKTNKSRVILKETRWMTFLALLPMVLMTIGHTLSRWDGAILIIVYGFYLWYLLQRIKKTRRMENGVTKIQSIGYTLLLLASLLLLFKSSDYVVLYGTELATELSLPPLLIGLFFVAVGTSLPELAFEAQAVRKGHSAMALGDITGSVIANSSLVLGVSAVINPITANYNLFLISAAFMLFSVFLFSLFFESGRGFTVREGIGLIFLYILFVITELTLRGVVVSLPM